MHSTWVVFKTTAYWHNWLSKTKPLIKFKTIKTNYNNYELLKLQILKTINQIDWIIKKN